MGFIVTVLPVRIESACKTRFKVFVQHMAEITHQFYFYSSGSGSGSGGSSSSKSSSLLGGGSGGSLLDLAPSPSDSGVAELEAALRDRDSELAHLRQAMEHNEQVIFRVYQEKERVWERELRRLKSAHENRLRTGAQRAHKLEQTLMTQTYQVSHQLTMK